MILKIITLIRENVLILMIFMKKIQFKEIMLYVYLFCPGEGMRLVEKIGLFKNKKMIYEQSRFQIKETIAMYIRKWLTIIVI